MPYQKKLYIPPKSLIQTKKIIINIVSISAKRIYFNIRQANNKAFITSLYKINYILENQIKKKTDTKKAN